MPIIRPFVLSSFLHPFMCRMERAESDGRSGVNKMVGEMMGAEGSPSTPRSDQRSDSIRHEKAIHCLDACHSPFPFLSLLSHFFSPSLFTLNSLDQYLLAYMRLGLVCSFPYALGVRSSPSLLYIIFTSYEVSTYVGLAKVG